MSIDIDTFGAVRVVTINRPELRNALDRDTFFGIGRAFVDAQQDDQVRAVVLTGAGNDAFCAGMDLKAFAEGNRIDRGDGPGTEVFVERFYPKPIIAAVNGAAVAGGFGIMLGCDLVVAADHAVFGLPEVKRGLVGVGAESRAAARLPPAITLELALTGELIDAQKALHFGLVNEVVPRERVLPTAIARAEQIATNAPLAVKLAKEIAYEARGLFAFDIAAMRAKAAAVFESDDAKEGTRAFAERRPPRFTGR
jgi:enoyl-CoA hydratase